MLYFFFGRTGCAGRTPPAGNNSDISPFGLLHHVLGGGYLHTMAPFVMIYQSLEAREIVSPDNSDIITEYDQ